jgi:hypothetical protein
LVSSRGAMFGFIQDRMTTRWSRIQSLFNGQQRFTIESVPGQFYAWIKCNRAVDAQNCYNAFANVCLFFFFTHHS